MGFFDLFKKKENAHGTKPPFDNLTFVSLGDTPCGIFSVTAGKKAVLPADPRAMFKTKREGSDTMERVELWRLFLYGENGEKISDLEYYRTLLYLKNNADSDKIAQDADGNLVIQTLSLGKLMNLKHAVELMDDASESEYWELKESGKPSGEKATAQESQETNTEEAMKDGKKTARGKPALWTAIAIAGAVLFALTRQSGFLGVAAVAVYIIRKEAKAHSQQAQPKITINDEKPFQEWMSEHPEAASNDDDESDTFYNAEEAEKILAELLRRTERQSVIIRTRGLDEGETLPFTQSRFGGLPYWESGADFPKSERGETMVLLAQINFEEVPHIKDFPEKGIVQFFVDSADPLAPVPGKKQDNWRGVFHKDPSEQKAVSEDTLKRLGVKTLKEIGDEGGNTPFTKVFALDFFETTSHISAYCEGRFEKEAKEAAKALSMRVPDEDLNADELFGEEALERFHLYEHSEDCHLIGGYPTFTQGDPRSAEDDYDVLLFQMDSEMKEGDWNDGILWGDCGIANFFISREDLQKRDFTNVLYNWDCY